MPNLPGKDGHLDELPSAITAVQGHRSDEIFLRGVDQFDRLYQEGIDQPRVMAISIHPYLTGAPHRIKYLEKLYDYILGFDGTVMWTGSEILDWYKSEMARVEGDGLSLHG